MTIDAFASLTHYRDHILPVWEALAPQVRGVFHTGPVKGKGPVIVAGYSDIRRDRSNVFLEHGAGQTYQPGHPSYSGGRNRGNVGLFLSPSERVAENNRRAYPNAEHVVVGCPKLDRWWGFKPDNPAPVVAISFHWGGPVPSALPYFAKALPELAKQFNLIGHAHPRPGHQARMRRVYEKLGIEFVADFTEVLRRADVYVCDNSSTIFEFAATGRPVVLMNAPQYKRLLHGFRFGWAAAVGVQTDSANELPGAITEALEDAPERRRAREHVIAQVYGVRDGTSAQRAADAIEGWLRAQFKVSELARVADLVAA